MNKINPIQLEDASQASLAVLEVVNKKLGRVPAMYKVMANSSAVLDAYVKLNGVLSAGAIGSKMAEMIALATAEHNGCSYCLSAHTFLGTKAGLTEQQIHDSKTFHADTEKSEAGLQFAKKILISPNKISSDDIIPLKNNGFTEGEILEIIANVIRNLFTNYVNIVSNTEIDWPVIIKTLNETTK
jgi:uncharacterized peroxidase-related enzyme